MILKIRTSIAFTLAVVSLIIWTPVAILGGWVLPEKGAFYVATLWGRWVTFLVKHIVGIRYKVVGKANIPATPCVVLSKHQSMLDIFVLLMVFSPQAWVFKRELLRIPFFGWALAATKPIAIDRSAGRQAMSMLIEQGKRKLAAGFWVVLYPEGTRTKPGEKGTYKNGGVMLAKAAGVPILPVALNTGLFWEKGKGPINTGEVEIVISPLIMPNEEIRLITQQVEASIEENTAQITRQHPYYLAMLQQKKEHNKS
ncbi:lysophospholipid acyltransferase family protein [Ostreibacterium oceani]|uniref:1-acyl-sn-glycerol-3-phosphate acyltransferase n=1 Tax=Ostreibacterium oceani TaxID=2654998 RepID=A0A6N7ETL4_9GAMM|nr:lysophospholipid acyltransferase family protein [Ostreibacterium oceani]MPV85283.1 1-acyl-sn-glycerol-3-phosphate acyltransferase [Ostreibacterium oceani]